MSYGAKSWEIPLSAGKWKGQQKKRLEACQDTQVMYSRVRDLGHRWGGLGKRRPKKQHEPITRAAWLVLYNNLLFGQ